VYNNKKRLAAGAGPRRWPGRAGRPGGRDCTTRTVIPQMESAPACRRGQGGRLLSAKSAI